jgi:tRNA threonylcarbamoyladenosine biosynthesis protein TsaB
MKLLALDTSSEACSVALCLDDDMREDHRVAPREHTRLLIPMIRGLMNAAGIDYRELDAIVLGNGPGSFIGMRIGASVAQGIAYAAGLDLVPVSSLAVVAAEVLRDPAVDCVLVTQDARMNEVYLAEFGRGEQDLPVSIGVARLHPAGEPAVPQAAGAWAAGGGWIRYPALLEASRPRLAGVSPLVHPRASLLLEIGRRELEAGRRCTPEALVPEYLRAQVAEKPAPRVD